MQVRIATATLGGSILGLALGTAALAEPGGTERLREARESGYAQDRESWETAIERQKRRERLFGDGQGLRGASGSSSSSRARAADSGRDGMQRTERGTAERETVTRRPAPEPGPDASGPTDTTEAPPLRRDLAAQGYTCSDRVAGWGCPNLGRLVAQAPRGERLTLPKGDYRQCFKQPKGKALTLDFQGGHMRGHACNGKAAIIQNADLTLENLECSRIGVRHGNGACVRQQGGALTLRKVHFHDAQSGVMSGTDVGPLRIENSRLIDLGGDCSIKCGRAHAIYYKGPDLHIVDSVIARARDQAHLVKTGAVRTVISNSHLDETGGQGSRIVDAYNGGEVTIRDSRITARRGDGNRDVVGYDYEARRGTGTNRIEIRGSQIDCAGGPLIAGGGSLDAAAVTLRDNRVADCHHS